MSAYSSGSIAYQGVSFLFGEGTPYRATDFVRGVATARVQDRDRVRGDGRIVGKDYKTGPVHTLSLLVEGDGATPLEREESVGPLLATLERVLDAAPVRARGGDVVALTIGARATLGRIRDVTIDDSGRWDGIAQVALQFAAIDDLWYGPEVVRTLGFVPTFTGGLPIPAAVPWVLGGGSGDADFVVDPGGDVGTWPVFEIAGPITDPWIDVGGRRLIFRGELAYDHVLTVDTRPWARWVKRNGSPFPGALSPAGVRLSDVQVGPDPVLVSFGGHDPTGTARLTTRVRPAFTSF